ncbi:MAG: hypothetical protein OEM23_06150, partial [Gemmatimonadota bacterium]|nr:hypothetical protein [Gemmatimonadota bacterium]
HRLFSTTILCSWETGDWIGRKDGRDFLSPVSCAAGVGYTIAHEHELWWSPLVPEKGFGDRLGRGRGKTFLSPNSCSSLVVLSTDF